MKIKPFHFKETPAQRQAVERAAAALREDPRVGEDLSPWADLFINGARKKVPSLLLEDFSDIPFLDGVSGVEWYQLRSRTRAGDGDVFASTQTLIDGYEEYNRSRLDLGKPEFLRAKAAAADPLCLAGACQADDAIMDSLLRLAEDNGGLLIHPYMGSRAVWELGLGLRKRTKVPVKILAPPPPASYAANHKGHLTRAATSLLGEDAVCATFASNDLKALARRARDFTERFATVALKMATYASAMGNKRYPSQWLKAGSLSDIETQITRFAQDHGWDENVEILLVEWRDDVNHSPSTQLWIPPKTEGSPWVDGVFEQILGGAHRVFQGSTPSSLAPAVNEKMAHMSFGVARILQELGYVGRCSFDFILCGKDENDARPLIVECNGRWGGTSIPMALCHRIFGRDKTPAYRARDFIDARLKGIAFSDFLGLFGDSVYNAGTGKGHFIFYNVGCLRDFGKFDVIALGADRAEASHRLETELPERIARGLA